MSSPENPPAFPCGNMQDVEPGFGMTLRDWFAGRAMDALICGHVASHEDHHIGGESDANMIASQAFQIADAMLAAREPQA